MYATKTVPPDARALLRYLRSTSKPELICALFDVVRRCEPDGTRPRPRVTKPAEAFALVRDIGRHQKEHLVGLYLDAQSGLICKETISIGSLNTTRSHPREILRPAIQHLALGFLLCHNHPSGSLEPSPEDLEFSRSIARAGEICGIELFDHLIVTAEGFTSLRELGLL